MILVDYSVRIDYLRGRPNDETDLLDRLLGTEPVAIGDLILTEVLQGIEKDIDYVRTRDMFSKPNFISIVGEVVALEAAQNYRRLRNQGITVRKTNDTLIATWYIADDISLLFTDRNFQPLVEWLGLRSAVHELRP